MRMHFSSNFLFVRQYSSSARVPKTLYVHTSTSPRVHHVVTAAGSQFAWLLHHHHVYTSPTACSFYTPTSHVANVTRAMLHTHLADPGERIITKKESAYGIDMCQHWS